MPTLRWGFEGRRAKRCTETLLRNASEGGHESTERCNNTIVATATALLICLIGCAERASQEMVHAIRRDKVDTVRQLLAAGHSPNAVRQGNTVLMVASNAGRTEIARSLIEAGAEVNAERYGFTALLLALKKGRDETARLLIDNGADIHQDRYGLTPLMLAADKDKSELVTLLLERGADIHAKDEGGWTALHFAVHSGREEVVPPPGRTSMRSHETRFAHCAWRFKWSTTTSRGC